MPKLTDLQPIFVSRRGVMAFVAAASACAVARPVQAEVAANPPPLSAYGRLPAIENVALSPDGKRVALVMGKGGERILYDYDLATGKASAAALQGDKLREVMWADNQSILVVISNTEDGYGRKYEQSYGLLMDLPAGKRRQLYSNIPNVVTSVVTGDFYRVKMDGAYRITASGFILPEGINTADGGSRGTETMERCLFAFNTASARGWKLDVDSRPVQGWVVKPDGTVVARSEYNDDTKTWTLRLRSDKGWKTIMEERAPYDRPGLYGLGRDGESVLILMRSGEDANRYFEISPTGERTKLDLDGETNYPIFHPQTYALAGFGNTGPIDGYVFFDPAFKRLPELVGKALPDSFNDLVAMAENPRQIVVRSENSEDSGTYFYVDFTTGAFKEIGRAYPDVPPEWIAPKKYITYKAGDGLEIGAWLTMPPGREGKNLALVVLPHGGPESMDDSRFDWLSQAIASRGYAVLQPNFRGSSGYGKAFTEKGHGEFGRKMQTDLSDGVRHLANEGIADPKRVAIAGASYGGYAALAGVTLQDGIYRCAVAIAGLSNLKTFIKDRLDWVGYDGDHYSISYWTRFMGDEARFDEISPVRFAAQANVPVMLIHGKDDVVVPYSQSQVMYDAMTRAGKAVEMVVMKGEDHWLSRETTRLQTLEAMVGFLLKHNPV